MALLKAGEVASGVKAKSDAKRQSTEKMIAAVQAAVRDPAQATPDLLVACQTQHNLAAWENEALGVQPMALNTLKKNVEMLYEGGWKGFLELCQRVETQAAAPSIKPGTRVYLSEENEQLKAENQRLLSNLLQASAQYLDLLRDFTELAKSHTFLQDRIRQHYQKYPNANRGLYVIEGGKDAHGKSD